MRSRTRSRGASRALGRDDPPRRGRPQNRGETPMQLVHVYLNFPGTTEEAFRFYETVFGTKIVMMQTFGDTPFIQNAPEAAKRKIMHVQLPITEAVHLMGSDAVEGFGPPFKAGNN